MPARRPVANTDQGGKYLIGSTNWIQHREGFPCLAEIIETRQKPNQNNDAALQYYVHYCNFDKRLDEWVDEDRFLSTAQKEELRKQRSGELSGGPTERTLTRELRKRFAASQGTLHFADPKLEQLEREHELVTRVKNVQVIQIGCFEIDCWYFSPYPDEYSEVDKLYICEKCLKYMRYANTLINHLVR